MLAFFIPRSVAKKLSGKIELKVPLHLLQQMFSPDEGEYDPKLYDCYTVEKMLKTNDLLLRKRLKIDWLDYLMNDIRFFLWSYF